MPAREALLRRCTVAVTAAYLRSRPLSLTGLEPLIQGVHAALSHPGEPEPAAKKPEPAVPISRSVKTDYLICLEDGRRMKTLKRYLRTQYGMTPEQYRQRWGLKGDYPMVAPAYATRRSELAKSMGLGHSNHTRKGSR